MRFRVITIIGKSGDRYLFEIKLLTLIIMEIEGL